MEMTITVIPFGVVHTPKKYTNDEDVEYVRCTPQEEFDFFREYIIRSIDGLYGSVCQLIHNTIKEQSRHDNNLSLARRCAKYTKNQEMIRILGEIEEIDKFLCKTMRGLKSNYIDRLDSLVAMVDGYVHIDLESIKTTWIRTKCEPWDKGFEREEFEKNYSFQMIMSYIETKISSQMLSMRIIQRYFRTNHSIKWHLISMFTKRILDNSTPVYGNFKTNILEHLKEIESFIQRTGKIIESHTRNTVPQLLDSIKTAKMMFISPQLENRKKASWRHCTICFHELYCDPLYNHRFPNRQKKWKYCTCCDDTNVCSSCLNRMTHCPLCNGGDNER